MGAKSQDPEPGAPLPPLIDLDAELTRLAALPLGERGARLAELARRLEAELDSTSAPLQDAEEPG